MKPGPKTNQISIWTLLAATTVTVAGGVGLTFVLTRIHPDSSGGAKVLLLSLLFITFGAGAVLVSAYLNRRFVTDRWSDYDPHRLFRHGLETGLLITLLAYLQMTRVLDTTMLAVLLGVFILMETFFLTRN